MKFLISTVVISLLVATSHAQDNAEDNTRALLDVRKMESMSDDITPQLESMINNIEEGVYDTPEGQALAKEYVNKLTDFIQSRFNWETLKNPVIEVYQKHYTEKEIEDMLAFFSTESGRAMTDKEQLVAEEVVNLLVDDVGEFMQMMKDFTQEKREAQNSGQVQ